MRIAKWKPAPERAPVERSLYRARLTVQEQRPASPTAPLAQLHTEAPKVSAVDEWMEQALARQAEKRARAKAAQEAEALVRVELEALATSTAQEWPEPQAWQISTLRLAIMAGMMGGAFATVHWGLTVLAKMAH